MRTLLFSFRLLLVPAATAALAAGMVAAQPPVTPPAGHPRLLLRPDDLPSIRASRDDPALAQSWAELKRRAYLPSDYKPETRYDGAVLLAAEANAFFGMVDNDHATKRRAIDLAFQLLGTEGPDKSASYRARQTIGRCLVTTAQVYDWCHEAMTPEERLQLCAMLRDHATVMEIKFPPTTPGAIAGHSSGMQLLRDQMAMAIATFDEDPEIYKLVAGRFYREFTAPRDFTYPGNFHHQGNAYGQARFSGEVWAAMFLSRMDAPPPWSLSAMSQVPYYFLYLRRPDGGMIEDGDEYLGGSRPGGSYWASPAHHWLHYTALFRDPQFAAQWRLQLDKVETKITEIDQPADPVLTILFRPDQVPSGKLETLPLTRYFPEPFGALIARTGWNVGPDSRDAVAYLKIGTHHFDNHQHSDSGQFQLFYRGNLAIDSGIYQSKESGYAGPHFRNYSHRAIAHNTLLIEDPDEKFFFDGKPIANDGGQRALDNAWTMEQFWTDPSRTGRVLSRFVGHHPDRPEVSLIKGDLTPAYWDGKARRITRTMAFLPLGNPTAPAALIVLDWVESVRGDQRKVALLHMIQEPKVEDNVVTVTRTGGQIDLLRWNPAAIEREHDMASIATLSFDLRPLVQQRIVKAELYSRTPWSLAGELHVLAGDRTVATVNLKTTPIPMPDVTEWIQGARRDSAGNARLTLKRIGGDSRGVVAPTEGPHAPHLRIWVEAEPYAGKLVSTTLLPAKQNLDLRKVGGPGQEFLSGGQNWPVTPLIDEPMAASEGGGWRVEVGDKSGNRETRFLNVHQVMDADATPVPVRLVQGRGVIGAALSGRMFLASETTKPIAPGALFEVTADDLGADGQVLIVMTDLPAGDHSLWQGDALIAMAAIEAQSHTWVTRLRRGTYELKSR